MDGAKADRLADALQEIGGGRSLVRAAEYHGVRGYLQGFSGVWERLSHSEMEPGDNQRYRVEQSAFALKVAGFQEVVGGVLNAHGIRFLGLKGLSLSQLLYGDICRREFGDLDLLVAPKDALRAIELFEQRSHSVTETRGARIAYPM